jgi:hypothetical protein
MYAGPGNKRFLSRFWQVPPEDCSLQRPKENSTEPCPHSSGTTAAPGVSEKPTSHRPLLNLEMGARTSDVCFSGRYWRKSGHRADVQIRSFLTRSGHVVTYIVQKTDIFSWTVTRTVRWLSEDHATAKLGISKFAETYFETAEMVELNAPVPVFVLATTPGRSRFP